MKVCTKCKNEKDEGEMAWKRRSFKLSSWCKECQKASQKKRYESNREAAQEYQRQYKYGLSPGEHKRMFDNQEGRCAVCFEAFGSASKAYVDHVHGIPEIKIRGLLCHSCNTGLGWFKDSPGRLLSAIKYLGRFKDSVSEYAGKSDSHL